MAKARVYYKGPVSFIHEASGTLIRPGENEIADGKTAAAIIEDSEGCYAEDPGDDAGEASERVAEVEPDDEDAPRPKGKTSRKK